MKRQIKTKAIVTLLLLSALGFFALFGTQKTTAAGNIGINKTVNFQGRITQSSSGAWVTDGTYTFTFKIYDVASGGTALWTESKQLALTRGVFHTDLGDTTPFGASVDFNNDSIYLGITFAADGEMSPRVRFTATPYAMNSDTLDGMHLAASGTNAHVVATDASGNLTVSGSTYFGGTSYLVNASGQGLLNTLGVGTASQFAVNASGQITAIAGYTQGSGNFAISGTGTFSTGTGAISLNGATSVTGTNTLTVGTGLTSLGGNLTIAGTTTTNGAVVLGDGGDDIAINSNDWDISSAGVATGFTGITSSGTITFSGLSTAGIVTNTAAGVLGTVASIPVANGGTNATSIGSGGTMAYSNGTRYAFSAVGTAGQALVSGGASTPTWFAPTAGSILFAGTSGILAQDNANFFWDNTNKRLGIGTATPGSLLTVASGGSDLFTVSASQAAFNVPTSFGATGDVSLAYDLLFNNQTSANIKTNAPLVIETGELFESNDVTLRTFNSGGLVLDTPGGITSMQAQTWTLPSSTTALNVAAGLFDIDTVNGRIGIGTTSPTARLQVTGSDSLATSYAAQIKGATGNGLIVMNTGAVGVGATPPTWTGDGSLTASALYANTGQFGGALKVYGSATGNYISSSTTTSWDSAADLSFGTYNLGHTWMTIKSAGNVGIGTISPSYLLSLGGTAAQTFGMERNTTAATAGQGMTITSGGAIAGTSNLAGGDLKLKSGISTGTGDSAIRFFTATAGTSGSSDNAQTEKMTILGNGNVGIGMTNPAYLLSVKGVVGISSPSDTYRLQLSASDNGTTSLYTSSTRQDFTYWNGSATVAALSYTNTGNVGIGTAAPVSKLHIGASPTASANYGTLSLGGGIFDGVTAGKFAGSASGTSLAINEASGYAGNLLDLQLNGTSKFSVDSAGTATVGKITGSGNTLTIGTGLLFSTTSALITAGTAGATAASTFTMYSNAKTNTSGQNNVLSIAQTYNQTSSTASNTDLLINRTETAVGSGAQYLLDAQVGGTSKFNVTNTGQGYFAGSVGIGTASPQQQLHVAGLSLFKNPSDTTNSLTLDVQKSNGTSVFNVVPGNATGVHINTTAEIGSITMGNGWQGITSSAANASGALVFSTNTGNTERMRITGDGYVGIGTGSPSALLSIGSTSQFQVNASGQVASGTWMGSAIGAQYGGTGIDGSTAANGKLLIGNGSGYTLATLTQGTGISITNASGAITLANAGVTSLTGTTGQVIVSGSTGAVTLSLPQNIANTSTPTFAGLNLSGLTSGSIPFIGAGGALSQNNAKFFWDNTNYRLGIGTATPNDSVDIFGASSALRLSYDATNYARLSSSSTGELLVNPSSSASSTITIGNNTAKNGMIVFDQNANDYYLGENNATGSFLLGRGSIMGTNPVLTVHSGGNLLYSKDLSAIYNYNDGSSFVANFGNGLMLDLNDPAGNVGEYTLSASGNGSLSTAYLQHGDALSAPVLTLTQDSTSSALDIYGSGVVDDDVIKVTSNSIGGGNFLNLIQGSGAFGGNGIKMSFNNDGLGTFNGNFLELWNDGNEVAAIFNNGAARFAGSVGVGTTAPNASTMLHVIGSGGVNENAFVVGTATGTDGALVIKPQFGTGIASIQGTDSALSETRNFLLNPEGGRVGIGNVNPDMKLMVEGGIHLVDSGGEEGNVYVSNARALKGRNFADDDWIDVIYADSNDAVNVGGINASQLYFNTSSLTAMTVANDGKVGIGTSSPSESLDVNGRLRLAQTTVPGTTTDKLYNVSGTLYWNGNAVGGGASQWTTSGSSIYYNGGNIGIGDASPSGLLTVGDGDLFQVNSAGAIAAATGITSSGNITFSGLSTAGILTNTSQGLLGTVAYIPVANGGTGTNTQFTQGSVVFAGASGVYNQDDAYFTYDSTSHTLTAANLSSTGIAQLASSNGSNVRVGNNVGASGLFHVGGGVSAGGDGMTSIFEGYIDSPHFVAGEYQNFLLQTEVFDNASWVKTGIGTVSANGAVAPNGLTIAENIPAGSDANANVKQSVTNATTGSWTFSVWLKAQSGSSNVQLRIDSSAETGTPVTASLTTRWQRYSVTQNFSSAHTTKTVYIISGTNAIAAWGAELDPVAYVRPYSGARTTTALTTLTRGALFPGAITAGGALSAVGVAVGGALTGATTGAFSSTVSISNAVTITRASLGVTSGDGLVLTNTTAATAGVPVQMSPRVHYSGRVWDTGAVASRQVDFINELLPVSGNPGASRLLWGYSYNAGAYAELMALRSSGNLGIGTTAPSYLLSLGGTAARTFGMERNTTAATAGQGLTITSGGAYVAGTNLAGGDLTLKSGISTGTGDSAIHFLTATAATSGTADNTQTEKMTILGSGNVGIGVTSPSAQFHTTGTVRFANFGAGTLTTDANGNVSVSSDERLKNITGTFTKGLAALTKIIPIAYRWNEGSGLDTQNIYYGFSAQNIQQAIPEAVGMDKNGFLTLSDRPILAATINAIKEQELRIDMQNKQIESSTQELFAVRSEAEVNSSALSQLQESLDRQLVLAGMKAENQDARIANMETIVAQLGNAALLHEQFESEQRAINADIQKQLDEIKKITDASGQQLAMAQIELNTIDISYIKTVLGLVEGGNLGDVTIPGKLTAKVVNGGALEMSVTDEQQRTIGTVVLPVANLAGGLDGKSIAVTTKAVTETSKIFITFQGNPGSANWVEKRQDEAGNYVGFTIFVAEPVTKDIKVDWWIVDAK